MHRVLGLDQGHQRPGILGALAYPAQGSYMKNRN